MKNTSATVVKYIGESDYGASATFSIPGIAAGDRVSVASDSNKKGSSYVTKVTAGKVSLYLSGAGAHSITLSTSYGAVECKGIVRIVKFKRSALSSYTGALVAYPGKKMRLSVTITGVRNPVVAYSSSNATIASVSKDGVLKAKKAGRCYVKAVCGGKAVKMLVEVTSKEGAVAVINAYKDMRTKIRYSQTKRMQKKYRDCSSFVSRCYWDTPMKRHAYAIGGSFAKVWALNAAAQAQWLNANGKRVAWKACSEKKLRPGDTVYFQTNYNGVDHSQWRCIDHSAIYVGNGYLMHTGGFGGKGTVGLRYYWAGDKSVKFIGRPC